ncbi:glycoside hydrolase family 3 C-terminal domain-containing protein [Burkholderia cenocepacia]|uniref:glycoside hydrolase family 3 protein n=1 Tax=Burkholderia cenocepacia TaxID=95486 RepID=UPI002865CFCD|nr:glycoside hydrolase family 3 C-terminal domain-containing protein [Burkholderia cenocepacia]MDR8075984.1 glycoside hydrolase family 3 C-terminal domain-containing protein [Burkholderia cenocepacia]
MRNVVKRSGVCLAAGLTLMLSGCGGGDTNSTASSPTPSGNASPWMDTSLKPEQRAALLVAAMALPDKEAQLVGGPGVIAELPQCFGARHIPGLPKYHIPTLRITNGPVGIGQNDCVPAGSASSGAAALTSAASAKATALPSAIAVAASFDHAVATQFGDVIGKEGANLALHVFEAPGMNLARLPVGGRNFEYMGEDPYLTGTLGVAEIQAVQSHGMIAMAKHLVANEQETNRMTISENVDDRTLHELYMLPFEMAVKDGQVGAVMCSYNSVNGFSMCENKHILTDVLRGQWGFSGYVQSDFFAAHSTAGTMLAGLDNEMPGVIIPGVTTWWTPDKLNAALASGAIETSDIDTALARRYTQMFKAGIFDRPLVQTPIDTVANGAVAKAIGEQSAVLLQNDGTLPLSKAVQNVVIVGKASQVFAQQAVAGGSSVGNPMGSGGGSSDVVALYTVSPLQGMRDVLANLGNSTAKVHLVLVDDANANATIDGTGSTFAAARSLIGSADAVVVMAGSISEEGADQTTFVDATGLNLDAGKYLNTLDWYGPKASALTTTGTVRSSNTLAMIQSVVAANPKTVLVLKDNAVEALDPTLLKGGASAPAAILEAWFPGQEDGHIVADLLFGVTNPSGKLPVTFPQVGQGFMDSISTAQYPGVAVNGVPTVTYTEGLNMGYRWYDAMGKQPAFEFGFGLSYTTFAIRNAAVSPGSNGTYNVTASVANTGKVAGAEVVQVYVGLPASSGEPPKRLVGFQKVFLNPGASQTVTVNIDPKATNHPLSTWDKDAQQWSPASGATTIYVGNSSRNVGSAGIITQ